MGKQHDDTKGNASENRKAFREAVRATAKFRARKGTKAVKVRGSKSRSILEGIKAARSITDKKDIKDASVVRMGMRINKVNEDKRVATGEVYAPDIIDSHGDMMEREDVEQLAYDFLAKGLNEKIDIMHNNKPALAVAVESWIARAGDTEYTEGSWVMSIRVADDALWDDIKVGKLNGYSMEVMVSKVSAVVELSIMNSMFGITEENNGHDHVFYVEMDDKGKIIGGHTSEDDDHMHKVRFGTATENAGEEQHSHRYFIP